MDRRWLAADFPRLFHVAEAGSWPSIEQLGLLSTRALLDRTGLDAETRAALEGSHRPKSVPVTLNDGSRVMLRDQKPLNMTQLARCLDDGMTAEEWLRLLNSKVFFWTTEKRLTGLLSARAYRDREHDVLVVETRRLVERYAPKITLTQINTGATQRASARRGRQTFCSIVLYPEEPRQRRRIAEVAIDYAVPDIAEYVLRVERRRGSEVVEIVEPNG